MILNVVVPIEVTRGQNNREHHFTRSKRVKAEREAVALTLKVARHSYRLVDNDSIAGVENLGARVTLLRPYARTPLDSDNLSGAFKGVRDEVASFLGVDDKSDRVHWRYVQCKAQKPSPCADESCGASTGKKKAGQCLRCFNADQSKLHVRLRIEILPASDIDPMATAVRVLKVAAQRVVDGSGKLEQPDLGLMVVGGFALSELTKALATADALATFDPQEIYNA